MSLRRRTLWLLGGFLVLILFYTGMALSQAWRNPHNQSFRHWWQATEAERQALITVQRQACPGAPFILPADGYIGLLYGDPRGPYSQSRPHQGLDIFSPGQPGETPVYAAYDGYITREAGWRSTLIQRIPNDPLAPERQIWLYYTHMAAQSGAADFIEDAFPPGTHEVFVKQGTLLGYAGDYNGDSPRSVWVHLHFSIVLDNGQGHYMNELEIENTVDPSPYLGMPVNHACAQAVIACNPNPLCT